MFKKKCTVFLWFSQFVSRSLFFFVLHGRLVVLLNKSMALYSKSKALLTKSMAQFKGSKISLVNQRFCFIDHLVIDKSLASFRGSQVLLCELELVLNQFMVLLHRYQWFRFVDRWTCCMNPLFCLIDQ